MLRSACSVIKNNGDRRREHILNLLLNVFCQQVQIFEDCFARYSFIARCFMTDKFTTTENGNNPLIMKSMIPCTRNCFLWIEQIQLFGARFGIIGSDGVPVCNQGRTFRATFALDVRYKVNISSAFHHPRHSAHACPYV